MDAGRPRRAPCLAISPGNVSVGPSNLAEQRFSRRRRSMGAARRLLMACGWARRQRRKNLAGRWIISIPHITVRVAVVRHIARMHTSQPVPGVTHIHVPAVTASRPVVTSEKCCRRRVVHGVPWAPLEWAADVVVGKTSGFSLHENTNRAHKAFSLFLRFFSRRHKGPMRCVLDLAHHRFDGRRQQLAPNRNDHRLRHTA